MDIIRKIITVAVIACLSQFHVAALDSAAKTELMKRCNAAVRSGVELLWKGMVPPAEVALKCDTLSHYLYVDTVSVPLAMKVISRLTVETYNIVAETGRTDYHQIVVALNSCKNVPAFYDRFFLTSAIGLGEHNVSAGNYAQAKAAFSLALRCVSHEKNSNILLSFSPYLHMQLAHVSWLAGEFDDAVRWQSEYVGDIASKSGEKSEEYLKALSSLAYFQQCAGQDDDADRSYGLICSTLGSDGNKDCSLYISSLLSRAMLLTSSSGRYYDELIELVGDGDELFSDVMSAAAAYYYSVRDYDKMKQCLDRVIKAVETDGTKAAVLPNFFAVLNAPGIKSDYSGKILKLLKKNSNFDSLTDCAVFATACVKCGRMADAASWEVKVKHMADSLLASGDSESIAEEINRVVEMYAALENFGEAASYLEQMMPHVEKVYGRVSKSLVRQHRQLLASYRSIGGDYHASRRITADLLADPELTPDERLSLAIEQAQALYGIGDYDGVGKCCDTLLATDIAPEKRWEILCLRISALISAVDVAYDRELPEYKKAMERLASLVDENRKFVDENFPGDAECLIYCGLYSATINFIKGCDDAMLRDAAEVEKIVRSSVTNPQLRSTYLSALAMYHIKAGDYSKALKMTDKDFMKSGGGAGIEKVYDSIVLSEIYRGLGKQAQAREVYIAMADAIMEMTRHNFSMLTETEKGNYWKMFERQIANAGYYAVEDDEKSDFGGVVYNLALFSKGLLLNSSRMVAAIMESSDDAVAAECYETLMNIRRIINGNRNLDDVGRKQLSDKAMELELQLYDRVPQLKTYVGRLEYDWRDLQRTLGDNDVAIEFLEFQNIGYDKYYAAAVVSRRLKNPVIVRIGKVEDIDRAFDNGISAFALWGKLLPYMSQTGKNYFSPVGKLHCLPVESLLTDDAEPLSAAYQLYRLSSTRELLSAGYEKGDGIAMFGGIDYGAKNSGVKPAADGRRAVSYSLAMLPGTRQEIDSVAALIESGRFMVAAPETYSGVDGTEENFRGLSGKRKQIIHVATHGYFVASKSSATAKLPYAAKMLLKTADDRDDMLLNNGLFMAGVNRSRGEDSGNDGVLTALDIASMNLSGTDLVVLSACETGLGNISGDGVFGLQRGFKLAGANSLMMSLRKVDDAATCTMMTEFYRRYLAGLPKRQAFEEAKMIIRKKYPDKDYWTSFVLLDAID